MLGLPFAALADGTVYSGDYTVRYSAVNSMQIPASVARDNHIERDGQTAVVMVTLQRPTADDPLHAVPARVSGYAQDLMGHKTTLLFDRIESAGSVYSLADVSIEGDPTLTFDLQVDAIGANATIPLRFNQQFFAQ